MRKFIHEHFKDFWKGAVGGGAVCSGILLPTPTFIASIPLDFLLKMLGAGAAALFTGLLTAYGADLYKHKIKPKLFKNVKSNKKDEEKAA
jgi:hypothetical protein